jgi:glycerol-3-phosphate dehydrogenase
METPKEVPSLPPSTLIDPLRQEAIQELVKQDSMLPAIVARAFAAASVGLRARVLSRLLPSVGPLALMVLGGGAFAKYVHQARWSALTVSFSDAARVTSTQIHELATYVQQSNPEVARQILSVLSRDVSTMTALGATLGAIMLSYLSGKTVRPGE